MKLRNKKTGEIVSLQGELTYDGKVRLLTHYKSLAELNSEWEDAEEPKTFWYMTAWGDVKEYSQDQFAIDQKRAIGNYFETKEEAELAVRKLKAWKRLKDKGFRFDNWVNVSGDDCSRPIWFYFMKDTELKEVKHDLDLLFGGEE